MEVAMIARIVLGAVLALHDLIHLLGFVVYRRLADVETLSYGTSLLSDALEVGEGGAWLVAAVGFIAAGLAVLTLRSWSPCFR
jgi:hypothetical protein